jgi:hypothetical protein
MSRKYLDHLATAAEYLSNGKTILAVMIGLSAGTWQVFTYINEKLTTIESIGPQLAKISDTVQKTDDRINTVVVAMKDLETRVKVAEATVAVVVDQKQISSVVPFQYIDSTINNVTDGYPNKTVQVSLNFSVTRDDCQYSVYRLVVDSSGNSHDVSTSSSIPVIPTLVVADNQTIKFTVKLPNADVVARGKARFQSRISAKCADGGMFAATSPWIPFYIK